MSENDYWTHINAHLKKNEVVTCMLVDCNFETNILGSFKSHKSRKHRSYSHNDFIPGIVVSAAAAHPPESHSIHFDDDIGEDDQPGTSAEAPNDLPDVIKNSLAAALLKLEHFSNVPSKAINDFLVELNHLTDSLSKSYAEGVLLDIFQKNKLQVDRAVIEEISSSLCSASPLNKAIEKGGPLSSSYQRKQYYKAKFNIVEPTEYFLDAKENKTFQYISILKSLQVLLNRTDIIDKIVSNHGTQRQRESGNETLYRSYKDGQHCKENGLLSEKDLSLSITLYADDFEVCNPLGTSRKTHKLLAVYWILENLPPGSHSSLSSIFLAILCKTTYVKSFGYEKIFEPLLRDLRSLEVDGIFVPQLNKTLKGTVQTIVADNLGAHGIAGFVENFTGPFICRFCTAQTADIQLHEVRSGIFSLRTKETHETHVKTALDSGSNVFGVKRACPFTKALSYFHVLSGYPPDIAHDLFEGIVPVEISHCLSLLISKKYITLDALNHSILQFPYKGTDKTNKPHPLPQNLSGRKSIGGNAHENWCLLRLLPFLIGPKIPENEPAWQILLDLKHIAELVVAPVHNDESIAFLESKVSDHRQRYQEVFPNNKLLPKHHYIEHYSELIKLFGPLVGLWTMRFEAKHSFFKNVVKHSRCFKNVPFSLALKHQFMIGYHLSSPNIDKPVLEVSDASTVPLELLKEELTQAFKQRNPYASEISIAKNVWCNGIQYRPGMIVAHGSFVGLPEFGEIHQICILEQRLFLALKLLCGCYCEHYGAFQLTPSPVREIAVVEVSELVDEYPLAAYVVGGMRMVTLKRSICV